jgi:hypothetical protein
VNKKAILVLEDGLFSKVILSEPILKHTEKLYSIPVCRVIRKY